MLRALALAFVLVGCTGVELREPPRDSFIAELVSMSGARRDREEWLADRVQRRCHPTDLQQATVVQVRECALDIGMVCDDGAGVVCTYQAETQVREFKFVAVPALSYWHGDWRKARTEVRLEGEERGPWRFVLNHD